MPKRKKHPRLPNGYGSIRFLGKNRKNPYAVHPPGNLDGNRPAALCYVDDWMKGFIILTAYNAGTYTSGMESSLTLPSGENNLDSLTQRILADYSRIRGLEPAAPEKTFSDVYNAFFSAKFYDGHKFSQSTVKAAQTAYKNCISLHNRTFRDLRADDLQNSLDACPLKHASLELIINLYKQMYKYADSQGWCDKDYSKFVKIKKEDDDEHGVSFTDDELKIFWNNKENEIIEMLLIMCYSGWRISEFNNLDVNLDEQYYQGGLKTEAGKNRIVPIHPAILPLVQHRIKVYGKLLPGTENNFRKKMSSTLEQLNIGSEIKHTPHDCRHTFSRLCEKYNVRENDRKRMMGHSFGADITNRIYGHRTLDDLKREINKICCDFFVTDRPE